MLPRGQHGRTQPPPTPPPSSTSLPPRSRLSQPPEVRAACVDSGGGASSSPPHPLVGAAAMAARVSRREAARGEDELGAPMAGSGALGDGSAIRCHGGGLSPLDPAPPAWQEPPLGWSSQDGTVVPMRVIPDSGGGAPGSTSHRRDGRRDGPTAQCADSAMLGSGGCGTSSRMARPCARA